MKTYCYFIFQMENLLSLIIYFFVALKKILKHLKPCSQLMLFFFENKHQLIVDQASTLHVCSTNVSWLGAACISGDPA